jgi:hypothetical protein
MAEGTIPGALLDRFNAILDRFSTAINSLSNVKKSQPTPGGGTSTIPPKSQQKPPGGGGKTTPDTTVSKEVDSTGLKSNFAPIAQDIINSGKIDTTKLSDRAAMGAMLAVGQMETNFNYDKAYTGRGGSGNNMQGFIQLNREFHPGSAFESKKGYLDYVIPKFTGKSRTFTGGSTFNPMTFAEKLKDAKTGWEVAAALKSGGFTVNDFDPLDTAGEANRLTTDQVQAIKKIVFGDVKLQVTQPTATAQPTKATVSPAQTQATNQQQLAQSVSQPPVQQPPQVNIAPLNLSTPQAQSTKVGDTVAPPPVMSKGGVTVPFLSSSNHDNFLTLYSKMVYNIVDG